MWVSADRGKVLSRHTETPGQHIHPCRRALAQVSTAAGIALWLG
jgi:hypothetical protein